MITPTVHQVSLLGRNQMGVVALSSAKSEAFAQERKLTCVEGSEIHAYRVYLSDAHAQTFDRLELAITQPILGMEEKIRVPVPADEEDGALAQTLALLGGLCLGMSYGLDGDALMNVVGGAALAGAVLIGWNARATTTEERVDFHPSDAGFEPIADFQALAARAEAPDAGLYGA